MLWGRGEQNQGTGGYSRGTENSRKAEDQGFAEPWAQACKHLSKHCSSCSALNFLHLINKEHARLRPSDRVQPEGQNVCQHLCGSNHTERGKDEVMWAGE